VPGMSQPRDPGRYHQQGPPQPYQQGPPQRYQQGPPQRYQQPQQYRPPVSYAPEPVRSRPRRIPGVGLILTLAGLVVQVLSLFVLPWVTVGGSSPNLTDLRSAAIDFGTHGFGAWYLVLFSYPLAALSIVLALAAVLDSVALKVVWACLALAGVAALVVSNGFVPLIGSAGFTTQKVTTLIIGLIAAAVVIFVLKSALSMFRRVAGLILVVFAGVHVAALVDLVKGEGMDQLSVGAYGPALGYVLTAVAAFTAPRRVPGV
jgi:hypothetical protein